MDYNDIVLVAKEYEKIDGHKASQSQTEMLSLGQEQKNKQQAEVIAKIWKKDNKESLFASVELPLHQVLDLAIFTCQTLLYFQDAYRFPKLYDPENPSVERIGLQGSVMPVSVCVDNPMIDEDIQKFSQIVSDNGETIGERLRALSRQMKEMGY
jgi:hypothetical protein